MKNWKLDRIISVATLVTSIVALFLVLKKPAPVAAPQPAATAAVNAQSFQQKVQQLDQPKEDGQPPADPTEFKVGDLNVPVSLVNDALQKKLSEQRDRLKLPDNVGGMKVENGELVMTQK
jgi:hypothetical protein